MRKIARKLYRAIPLEQPPFELLRRSVQVSEPASRRLHFQGVIDERLLAALARDPD